MTSLPKDKLERLVERWHTIQAELNAGASQASYVKLTREFSELDPVVAAINNLTALERMCLGHKIADVVAILGSIDILLGEVDR